MKFLWLILLMPPALACGGFLYQWVGARNDRRRYAGLGRWIDVGRGCILYLLEKGSANRANGPTVIFESGIAATNLNWHHVQRSVSQFSHTVSYDRGGLGWSSASLTPRTPGNIAIELRTMLEEAGIKPPYVLVGHSFGGLVMRRFSLLYPDEVKGVILVDPMRLEEWPPINPSKQAVLDRGCRMSGYAVLIARFGLARLAVTSLLCRSGKLSTFLAGTAGAGGVHVLSRIKSEVSKMPREVWPVVAAHWSRPSYYAGMCEHVIAVPDTIREMRDCEPIVDIPVVLLTPGKAIPVSLHGMEAIGNNVQQLIAKDSEHWIHLDEPELVIESIREMVAGDVVGAVPVVV